MRPIMFGATAIPQGNGTMNNPIPFRSSLVPLRGGAYDQDGQSSYSEAKVLNYSAWVRKDDGDGTTTIDDVIDDLMKEASRGLRILQVEMRDGTKRIVEAKLVQAQEGEDANVYFTDEDGTETGGYAQLQLAFEIPIARWTPIDDDVWFFDSGEFFDSGLYFNTGNQTTATISTTETTFTIDNDGGADVYYGQLFIDADTGESITDIRIDNLTTEEYVEWTGTLNATERFEINLEIMDIEVAGVNAWDDTTLPNTQTRFWKLALGENEFKITVTSVTGTPDLTYYWSREYLR